MRRLSLLLICSFLLDAQAVAGEKRYVSVEVLNVRLCPADHCPVTNRIYRQQAVEVFEVRGEWARISKYYDAAIERTSAPTLEGSQAARWVALTYLVKERPGDVKRPEPESSPSDPRIGGIPRVGEYGLSRADVLRLVKYAKRLLENGECEAIDVGDKSVSRSGTYYVHCVGESQNRFFTATDVE